MKSTFLSALIALTLCNVPVLSRSQTTIQDHTTWYGEVIFPDDEIYLTKLELDLQSPSSFVIHLPEMFNSIIKGTASATKDTLLFTNQYNYAGFNLHADGIAHFVLTDNQLQGTWSNEGTEIAQFTFSPLSNKSSAAERNYNTIATEMNETFGQIIHGEEIESAKAEDIISSFSKKHGEFPVKYFSGKGSIDLYGLPGNVTMAFKSPNSSYFKASIGSFMESINLNHQDTIWNYDSSTKTTVITAAEKNWNKGINDLADQLINGKEINSVHHATVNGASTYRVEIIDDDIIWYFVDAESLLLVQTHADFSTYAYSDFMEVKGFIYPKIWSQVDMDGTMKISYDSFSIEPFDENIFTLPEDYLTKTIDNYEKDDQSLTALNDEAVVLLDNGDTEAAITMLNEIIKQDPSNYLYYFNRGVGYQDLGEYYKAISDFTVSLELEEDEDAYNRRGVCKYMLSDYESSIEDFENCLRIDDLHPDARRNLLNAHYELGQGEPALEIIESMIERKQDSSAYHLKGFLLMELERYEEAIVALEKSIEENYHPSETYNVLGVSNYRLGNYQEALSHYTTAHKLDTTNFTYYQNIADSHFELGQFEEAETFYETAMQAEDVDLSTLKSYALTLRRLDKFKQAYDVVVQALEMEPGDPENFDIKGLIEFDLDQYQESIDSFTRSIGIYPDDPAVYYWRAISHETIGNRHSACKDLQAAAEMEYQDAIDKLAEYCTVELE